MKINHILKEYEYDPAEDSKAVDQYNMLKRQVGEMYAEAFWRMWRKTANVNAALRMTQEEYDRMVRYESVEEDNSVVKEAMSDAYGIVSAEPEVEGSVEFKQHKNTDKGSVSIEAAGDTMQDLADVLKLAGLTLPQDMYKDEPQASADDHEPEQEDVLLSPDHEDDKEESPCDSSDDKMSYETDKEILINYIKDKLKKSIS
jgi:hypothetical protein